MDFLIVYGTVGLVILSIMLVLWLVSLILRNASIVDILWGTGFVVSTWLYYALTPVGLPARKLLIGLLVTIWGLRLSLYILWRNAPKGEDFRYRKWREEAGSNWWWQSFFKVFFLQGLLMWIISTPLLAAQILPGSGKLGILDYLAILAWLIGFIFEAGGDWQLARFKANPANKGKLLTTGLWRYTRHPNYFGDALQWWSYYLIAAVAGGFWTIFSPLIMTLLLRNVSGVTLLEKTLQETRPGYREYVETTNAFIPWFPKTRRS